MAPDVHEVERPSHLTYWSLGSIWHRFGINRWIIRIVWIGLLPSWKSRHLAATVRVSTNVHTIETNSSDMTVYHAGRAS